MIETVTGPDDLASPGIILFHEHLIIDYGALLGDPMQPVDAETVETLQTALSRLVEVGVSALVDCTPPHYGRYLDVMQTLSQATGLAIVAATGSFCDAWAPLPPEVARASAADLAAHHIKELQTGAGSTSIRTGVIKAATGGQVLWEDRKRLTAAAEAQRVTGAPIVSHTTSGEGLDQLDVYEGSGADPARIAISHVGFEADALEYASEIARRGAYVGLDRIGSPHFLEADAWLRLVDGLVTQGHIERILLSHDAVTRFDGPAEIAEHTFSDYSYIPTRFVPELAALGLSEAEIRQITETNPRVLLTGADQEDSHGS